VNDRKVHAREHTHNLTFRTELKFYICGLTVLALLPFTHPDERSIPRSYLCSSFYFKPWTRIVGLEDVFIHQGIPTFFALLANDAATVSSTRSSGRTESKGARPTLQAGNYLLREKC
jgi:hypothetical protein